MTNERDIEALEARLNFDPETGTFTWKDRPRDHFTSDRAFSMWNAKFSGRPALATKHSAGYLVGRIDWTLYKAHRVAFAFYHGRWPNTDLDHRNQNKTDNRKANLREVTNQQNHMNRPKQANNSSGHTGVAFSQDKQQWFARIKVKQKLHHLGYFSSFDQAVRARKHAEIRYGFSPQHGH